ncbi:MAG: hypothetical protein WEB03_00165 [Nitriliruptor sp.]|uniref:hypothetical protein n=1 Tax=Nitriliruptor sp. TaxID=2448056 RepID=UPI0034A01388
MRLDRRRVGQVLVVIGTLGVVASVLATIVGMRLLGSLDRALEDSVGVAAEAIDALGATVELAGETTARLAVTLERTATTTRDLSAALADAEQVLRATADISEDQVAGSVEALEDTLPALVQVAAVIDRTLSALSVVPFGPEYDPAEPFDDSLRAVSEELDGLPEALREQAELIREGSRELRTARVGTAAIADDLDSLGTTLERSTELVERYAATAAEARELVSDDADLGRQLALGRVLVLVLGLTFAAGQLLPLGAGWLLQRPDVAAAFLAPRDGESPPPR